MMGGFAGIAATVPSLITRGTGVDNLEAITDNMDKRGSVSMFQSLMGSINAAFADVGMVLAHEDRTRIHNTIRKLGEYEQQLARMCAVLITIVKIARFYGIGLDSIDRDHPRQIQLSQIQSIDDIRDFVRRYARDLTKTMATNMSIQQSAAFELMSNVTPRLIDECVGKSGTPAGTPAAASTRTWHKL
jgi:hypothetical protein